MLRRVRILVLVCVVVFGAACGGGGGNHAVHVSKSPPSDRAVRTFGYGPSTDGSAHYQPGVVVISDGPGAIRSASADGLTVTINRNAHGASKLRVGSIMLATSRAAGRVVAMQDVGDNRIVTLAPVQLTDIVRDGRIDLNTSLDSSSFTYQQVPDLPGKISQPTPGNGIGASTQRTGRVVRLPAVVLTAAPTLPDALNQSVSVPVGEGWTVQPTGEGGQLGIKITRGSESGPKVSASLLFATDKLRLHVSENITGGSASNENFYLEGVKGLTISIAAGIASDVDNGKIKIEVPIKLEIPIPPSPATAGIPLDIKVEFTAAVETALTGNNSTLVANGQYGLAGPIGIMDGALVGPTFTVQRSIIDSITGIALGPSGVVLAVKMKVQVGAGTAAVSAGPYGSIVTSIGLTNGSSIGAPLARCKSATLDLDVIGGIGLSLSNDAKDVLTHLLPKGTKIDQDVELKKKNVLHREQIVPDVPVCHGGLG